MMNDQCRYCQLRGNLKECQAAGCGHHDNWINQQLRAEKVKLIEALELANAALSGANMNMNVVQSKVTAALAKARGEVDDE